jgi:hypothetical protein
MDTGSLTLISGNQRAGILVASVWMKAGYGAPQRGGGGSRRGG